VSRAAPPPLPAGYKAGDSVGPGGQMQVQLPAPAQQQAQQQAPAPPAQVVTLP